MSDKSEDILRELKMINKLLLLLHEDLEAIKKK